MLSAVHFPYLVQRSVGLLKNKRILPIKNPFLDSISHLLPSKLGPKRDKSTLLMNSYRNNPVLIIKDDSKSMIATKPIVLIIDQS